MMWTVMQPGSRYAVSCRALLPRTGPLLRRGGQQCGVSTSGGARGAGSSRVVRRSLGVAAAALGAVGAGVVMWETLGEGRVHALDLLLHPPALPWYHKKVFHSLDHASMRRGYEVYKQVCAACHSLKYMKYRHLINVIYPEERVVEEAAEMEVQDGPDDEGNMFMRPGKPTDEFAMPYKNDEEAMAANNGALPKDLTFIVLGREGGEDYIFHILTSYMDPPAGMKLGEGQHYNPYFSGGILGMAQALYTDMIEYEDGTPASQSQMAKDVVTFLKWCGEQEFDLRARLLVKVCLLGPPIVLAGWYINKRIWSPIRSMKMQFKPKYAAGQPQLKKSHLVKKTNR